MCSLCFVKGVLRLRPDVAPASSSSCWLCLIWRRRFLRKFELLRGSSAELDELELLLLLLLLLEWSLSNFVTLLSSFLRRSFLLLHFFFACFRRGCMHLLLSQRGSMMIMMVGPCAGAPHKIYDDR